MNTNRKVAIVGSGVVGRSWAILFSAARFQPILYDIKEQQLTSALQDIKTQLEEMERKDQLRGELSAHDQLKLISSTLNLEEAIRDAMFIMECVPEDLVSKQIAHKQIEPFVSESAIVASSSSGKLPSHIFGGLAHMERCLVTHPVNPPLYLPAVEVCPSEKTLSSVVERTCEIFRDIKMKPVVLKKEIDGFVVVRIQDALLAECWRLVQNDVISVADLDTLMTDGLGPRWAFIGPMLTMHLNANGLLDYCDKFGEFITGRVATMCTTPAFDSTTETAQKINGQLLQLAPLERLSELRKGRDEKLAALAKLKKEQ